MTPPGAAGPVLPVPSFGLLLWFLSCDAREWQTRRLETPGIEQAGIPRAETFDGQEPIAGIVLVFVWHSYIVAVVR